MEIQRGDHQITTTHWWWRPGWGPETRYLTFHLTFDSEPALAAVAERHSRLLTSLPNVDPVPTPWLHLTMTGVGHVSEVSDEIVQALCARIIDDAADHIDQQPAIVFDALYFGRDGLSLTGNAPDWLTTLRQQQEQAVEDLLGGPREWYRVRPHVSLAYYDGEVDESALLKGITDTGLDDVVITGPTLSLLELRREGHLYRWRTVGERRLTLAL